MYTIKYQKKRTDAFQMLSFFNPTKSKKMNFFDRSVAAMTDSVDNISKSVRQTGEDVALGGMLLRDGFTDLALSIQHLTDAVFCLQTLLAVTLGASFVGVVVVGAQAVFTIVVKIVEKSLSL